MAETGEWGRHLHRWEGAVKEEGFPRTGSPFAGGGCGGRRGGLRGHGGGRGHGGAEGRAERFPRGGSAPGGTHQP